MEDKKHVIQTLASELIEKLGFRATIEVQEIKDVFIIDITTDDDAPLLIGRHAHMLSALQRILGAMLFKSLGEPVDILVDVNNYREGQKERLIGIADNVARRVLEEDHPARLSSFSAYERRIIHEHINENYQSLESFSEGEGMERRLVIQKRVGP